MASDNQLSGAMPHQFQDFPTLSSIDLSNNRLSGRIPDSLASCERLVSLTLRGNGFTGEIPLSISLMPTLAILDLSSNQLTGHIPVDFGNSPALEMLNLSSNNLSGPVPTNGILRTINPNELSGNLGLCGAPLPPCASNISFKQPSSVKVNHIKHIITGWLVGVSAVLTVGAFSVLVHRLYLRWQSRLDEETGAWPWRLTAFQRFNFTSADILACIKESNVVGMGATGVVYKAEIPRQHATLAIKKLWRSEPGALSLAGEFIGEVSLLGKLRHRNIVRMMGYMHNDMDAMIVYEYMPNGSLWEALHGDEGGRMLVDWVSRYNVAVGLFAPRLSSAGDT
ncbi:uncharacterized protein A4U43_C04F2880 [Asparagus officinalis]|uniref:non-specific serine/threonine protein kinase n=1 Tax=Asparagus officinalis TaxID=4686 RepID=A0A5P1F391_ASPOF|nr:uncharacterized protein A4U43_C04F2880 [Asparagus officinalis]